MIKLRRLSWAGHMARMEEGRSAFNMLTCKPLGRPRRRWEENIRRDLKGTMSIRGIGLVRLKIGVIGVSL